MSFRDTWTLSAIECFDLNQGCMACTMNEVYNYQANYTKQRYIGDGGAFKPCFMYKTVERMVNNGGPPTTKDRRMAGAYSLRAVFDDVTPSTKLQVAIDQLRHEGYEIPLHGSPKTKVFRVAGLALKPEHEALRDKILMLYEDCKDAG